MPPIITRTYSCCQATMSFDREKAMPGEEVNLNLQAEAASTCFVGMVDKSVNLLGGSRGQLTPDMVRTT